VRGPARVAEIGGDKGDWTVVRYRKGKATKPKLRGRERSRVSERHGGASKVKIQDWKSHEDARDYGSYSSYGWTDDVRVEGRVFQETWRS